MKFQCGECEKFFTINNIQVANEDIEFQCDNCNNYFFVNRNLVFSSSSQNSNILCENCGKLIPETNTVCNSCNLILNKTHEELRIDNKDYESLKIGENGKVYNVHSGKKLKTKSIFIPAMMVFIILSIGSVWYFTNTNNNQLATTMKSRNLAHIETQVIIMKSGQTYYAETIEKDGDFLKVTNKNGSTTKVLEKNVLQISKAVIDG